MGARQWWEERERGQRGAQASLPRICHLSPTFLLSLNMDSIRMYSPSTKYGTYSCTSCHRRHCLCHRTTSSLTRTSGKLLSSLRKGITRLLKQSWSVFILQVSLTCFPLWVGCQEAQTQICVLPVARFAMPHSKHSKKDSHHGFISFLCLQFSSSKFPHLFIQKKKKKLYSVFRN